MMLRAALRGFVLAGSTIMVSLSVVTSAAEISRKVDEPAARRLVAEQHYRAAKYLEVFDYDPNLSPPFYVYYGLTEPPVEGSFGSFAVNPWTGDVWSLRGCRKLFTPAFRKSQAKIRERFTRDELKQYARLRRLKPECI